MNNLLGMRIEYYLDGHRTQLKAGDVTAYSRDGTCMCLGGEWVHNGRVFVNKVIGPSPQKEEGPQREGSPQNTQNTQKEGTEGTLGTPVTAAPEAPDLLRRAETPRERMRREHGRRAPVELPADQVVQEDEYVEKEPKPN